MCSTAYRRTLKVQWKALRRPRLRISDIALLPISRVINAIKYCSSSRNLCKDTEKGGKKSFVCT